MSHTSSARLALMQLRDRSGGGLEWQPGAMAAIGAALAKDLVTADATKAIDELLRLMSVLRKKRGSPEAADALGRLLRSTPGARALVRGRFAPVTSGIDQARGFAHREGRRAPLRAPSVSGDVPAGALPLRTLINPSGADRARALTPKTRKDPHHGR